MIIDCGTWKNKTREEIEQERFTVLVDGKEISHVFYLDTDAGFVRTFDVFGDGKVWTTCSVGIQIPVQEFAQKSLREAWELPENGVASKTIHGVVELRLPAPKWSGE